MINSTWKRILCGILCAAMCWGILPGAPVFAAEETEPAAQLQSVQETMLEEAVEETVPEQTEPPVTEEATAPTVMNDAVMPADVENDAEGRITFTTIDDLKTLLSGEYDTATDVFYVGEEELVIDSNLTVPANLYVRSDGAPFAIADNVEVNCGTTGGIWSTVTTFGNNAYINYTRSAPDFAKLTEYLADADAVSSNFRFLIDVDGKISANKGFTVPAQAVVNLNGGLYLYPGTTMTVDGAVSMAEGTALTSGDNCTVNIRSGGTMTVGTNGEMSCRTLTVSGSLELNGRLTVSNLNNTGTLKNNGSITLGDGKTEPTYTGTSRMEYLSDGITVTCNRVVDAEGLLDVLSESARKDGHWEYNIQVSGGTVDADCTIPVQTNVTMADTVTVAQDINVTVRGELNVEGKLKLNGCLYVIRDEVRSDKIYGVLNGASNIEYGGTSGTERVIWEYTLREFATLKEAVAVAGEDSTHWRVKVNTGGTVTMTESITVPENVDLTIQSGFVVNPARTLTMNSDLIVAQSGTLTVKGTLELYQPALISGKLVNSQYIKIYHDFDYTRKDVQIPENAASYDCGVLDAASYSGNGYIYAYADMPEIEHEEITENPEIRTKETQLSRLELQLAFAGEDQKEELQKQIDSVKAEICALKEAELLKLDERKAKEVDAQKEFLKYVLRNLDLEKFFLFDNEESDPHYWSLRSIEGLKPLGSPTTVEWGKSHQEKWNIDIQALMWQTVDRAGSISWVPVSPDQGRAKVDVYRYGEEKPVYTFNWSFGSYGKLPPWRSISSLCTKDLEEGYYYFEITSIGDFVTYYNSEPVRSPIWVYSKADSSVGVCRDVAWNWPQYTWNVPEDATNVAGYEVEIFYGATLRATPVSIGRSSWYEDLTFGTISDTLVQQFGDGYYYFRVRALSGDLTLAGNGTWSELSDAYSLTAQSKVVASQLSNLYKNSGSMDTKALRNAVQSIGQDKLKQAMLTDQSSTGVVSIISNLEKAAGGPAQITVTKDVQEDFDPKLVSVVGANLNDAIYGEQPITFIVDKPSKEQVVPESYGNALLVRFSMNVNNVRDPENLDMPIKITLPIPYSMSLAPERMVILHYLVESGEIEEIRPFVYCVDGQWFASFVVTSFSDFTMVIPNHDCSLDGHVEAVMEAVAPTCIATGLTEGKRCSVCEEVLTAQEEIPFGDHSYGQWVVTVAPTCVAAGEEQHDCTVCGHSETRAAEDPDAHNPDPVTKICTLCGEFCVALGDANGDGEINNVDAMLILQHSIDIEIAGDFFPQVCDVNGDTQINNVDAMLILQRSINLIEQYVQ